MKNTIEILSFALIAGFLFFAIATIAVDQLNYCESISMTKEDIKSCINL